MTVERTSVLRFHSHFQDIGRKCNSHVLIQVSQKSGFGIRAWYDLVMSCSATSECEFLLLDSNLINSDSEITQIQPSTQAGLWTGDSSVLFSVCYGPMILIIIFPTQTSEEYWARCNVSSLYVPTQMASKYPKITFWREEGGGVLIHLGVFLLGF